MRTACHPGAPPGTKERPAPEDRGKTQSKNAGKRPPNHIKIARTGFRLLRYEPPEGAPFHVRLGPTDSETLEALRRAPSSRLDLMKRHPRLGLSAPQAIERLRKAGLDIENEWTKGKDGQGEPVRFVRYRLLGRVLEVQRA